HLCRRTRRRFDPRHESGGVGLARAGVADRQRRPLVVRRAAAERTRFVRALDIEDFERRRRRRRIGRRIGAVVPSPPPDTATLMLLDTYGLVYRAFFALPVMNTASGVPTNAAYGFTMMLLKVIADERPTHVVAAFDKGRPRARIERYPEYKATRQ